MDISDTIVLCSILQTYLFDQCFKYYSVCAYFVCTVVLYCIGSYRFEKLDELYLVSLSYVNHIAIFICGHIVLYLHFAYCIIYKCSVYILALKQ